MVSNCISLGHHLHPHPHKHNHHSLSSLRFHTKAKTHHHVSYTAPSDAHHRSLKHSGWRDHNLSSSRSVNNFGLSRSGVIRPRLSAMTGSEVGDSGYDESQFDPTLTNDDLKPTKPSQRTFSWLDMSSLWIGLVVGVPTYYLAGSLVDLGMAWWQGIATVVAANLILLVPLVLTAQPGTMYGISFPVLARSSFGIRGAHIPTLLRALVGCGWYGIETWIGGEAIFLLLPAHIKNSALSHTLPWLGTSPLEFSCFIVFWLAQLCIVWRGMDGIRKLEKYAAPVLITLTSCLLVWSYVKAGGFGHMLSLSSKLTSAQFWTLFFPSLTANISFWATLALNIPDFSRFAKSQTDQIIGQVGLPVFMGLFTFVGLAVTSSTSIIFGRVISNPIQLLGQIGGLATTLLAILGISLATITTNIAANVVAPANALVNLNPKVFTFGRGALLTAVLGIVCQPWRLLKSSESFVYTWLIGYSALLGPIGGIVLADYYLIKKMKLNIGDLYSSSASGEYYYSKGYNAAAVVALVAGIIPVVPGFLHKVGGLSKISNGFVVVYDNALFFSFIIAGFVYWMLMSRLRTKQSSSSQPLLKNFCKLTAWGAYQFKERSLEEASSSTVMMKHLHRHEKEVINGFILDPSQTTIAKWIFTYYPETAVHVQSQDLALRTKDMNVLLDIFETLSYKKSCDISEAQLRHVSDNLSYLKRAGFKVEWLRAKFDDVSLNACEARIVKLKEEVKKQEQMVSYLKDMLKYEEAKLKKLYYLEATSSVKLSLTILPIDFSSDGEPITETKKANVKLQDDVLRTRYMNLLFSVIKRLYHKPLSDLTEDELSKASLELSDVTQAGFSVEWLASKLEKVTLEKKTSEDRIRELEEEVEKLKLTMSEEKVKLKKQPSWITKTEIPTSP
ncbi:unnamed protein product [Brassica rapa subsp. narinosa]